KLQSLIDFEAAVFYEADLAQGIVKARYTVGRDGATLSDASLNLEQKLTGWVAANNQALCNLPPFPDFLNRPEPKPAFQISAIAPLNSHGEVLGAISLYRKEANKFTEEEFRRLEIVASQTSVLLAKCNKLDTDTTLLFDQLTGLPNAFHLYLMFDRVA